MYIERDSFICRELIEEIYKPVNLGVIDLTEKYLYNEEAILLICKMKWNV
jgi:hypothetical protein